MAENARIARLVKPFRVESGRRFRLKDYDPATQLDPVTGYPESCAAGTLGTLCATSHEMYNYGFGNFVGFPNTHDVGVVILANPVNMATYGVLPGVNALDQLKTGAASRT